MEPLKLHFKDSEIEADIHRLLHRYPPLAHDRHCVHFHVHEGTVTINGYVKSIPTYVYVKDHMQMIPGITHIDATEFFNDEDIRLHVGHVVPMGVQVNLEYGAVILAGTLPEGVTVEDLVKRIALVPGVHRVVTSFA